MDEAKNLDYYSPEPPEADSEDLDEDELDGEKFFGLFFFSPADSSEPFSSWDRCDRKCTVRGFLLTASVACRLE